MKIVDTLAEQSLLETLLERTKPPVPAECRDLHYLLATPFRYGAPYPSGSRFRRAGFTPGVFYGSTTPATAVAEIAFHRLLFFADSPADAVAGHRRRVHGVLGQVPDDGGTRLDAAAA